MAEDKVIIDESVEDLKGVAKTLRDIADGMMDTIQAAIQMGYDAAADELYGYYGDITIPIEKWSADVNGKIECKVVLKDASDNGIIIFSPSTRGDREQINYAELFVSPIVENSTVTLTCERTPEQAVKMSYIIMRNGALKTTKKGAI